MTYKRWPRGTRMRRVVREKPPFVFSKFCTDVAMGSYDAGLTAAPPANDHSGAWTIESAMYSLDLGKETLLDRLSWEGS